MLALVSLKHVSNYNHLQCKGGLLMNDLVGRLMGSDVIQEVGTLGDSLVKIGFFPLYEGRVPITVLRSDGQLYVASGFVGSEVASYLSFLHGVSISVCHTAVTLPRLSFGAAVPSSGLVANEVQP